MPARYFTADFSVNLAPTGGIDKAVLESMAAGVPTLAANRAFKSYFGMYADRLLFMLRDPRDLAEKIASLASSQDFPALRQALCAAAAGSSIERVVGRIMELFA
jgi:glycosyltransferase involved in cell wall biosynthesis